MSSNLPRVEDLVSPPVIGQRYLVPCVLVPREGIGSTPFGWWPVNGRLHDDADLGVPQQHYHFDPRFMSTRQFECRMKFWERRVELLDLPHEIAKSDVLASILPQPKNILSLRYQVRRMTCMREMPLFPRPRVMSTWLPGLEERYADKIAKDCRTCPHRGLPLSSIPVDEHGMVTCPGHGLRWNRKTGNLVREGQVC